MSIKTIIESPGVQKRSYKTGHTFRCFKCSLWVRWLGNNEMCSHCQKETRTKDTLKLYATALKEGEA